MRLAMQNTLNMPDHEAFSLEGSPIRKVPLSSSGSPALQKTAPEIHSDLSLTECPSAWTNSGRPEERPQRAGTPKSLESSAEMFAVPESVGRCSTGSPSRHTRNLRGSFSPKKSPGGARPSNRPASLVALRKRPCTPDTPQTLALDSQIDDLMSRSSPRSARFELPIDELLSRSCVTSLARSQSCPAFQKQGKKVGKQRTPMPLVHLVLDQCESEKEPMGAHGHMARRRMSLAGAGRAVRAAVRMRHNSIC